MKTQDDFIFGFHCVSTCPPGEGCEYRKSNKHKTWKELKPHCPILEGKANEMKKTLQSLAKGEEK